METALQKMGAIRRMADGGLVSPWSLKGIANKLAGPKESVSEKYARQDAERAAKGGGEPGSSPAPKAAPASPAPGSISGYAAGSAMQAREKAAGLKGGGAIKGKGTGTSDDIPIMASNGEFMIKAKAVRKIGVETLEALNAIADKPDEKEPKAENKAEGKPAMKCGGAVRKMAMTGIPHMEAGGGVDEARRLAAYVNHRAPNGPPAMPPPLQLGNSVPGPGTAVTAAPYQPNFTMGSTQASAPPVDAATDVRAKYNPANGSPEAKAWQASRTATVSPGVSPATTAEPAGPPRPSAIQRMGQGLQSATGLGGQIPATGVTGAVANLGRGALRFASRAALPIAAASEGLDVARVAADPNATGIDVATQTAQGAGRMAAAGVGAGAGAAMGTAVFPGVGTVLGGLAGGALGYYGANKAIEAGRNALGAEPSAPATRAPSLLPATTTQTPPAGQVTPQPAVQAPATAATTLAAPPTSNVVTRTGNSYSGGPNITGDISLQNPNGSARTSGGVISAQNNQAAAGLDPRYRGMAVDDLPSAGRGGGQVSSMDTSQGYAQDLKDLARIDATKAAEQANAKSQEAYAQNAMLQDRALRGNRGAGAIRAANIATATTQRGQDQQAQAQGAIQKLAQQKFGLESQTAGLDNASKVQMQAAQAKLLAAKTPEEKLAAEENLRALQGKYEKAAAPQKFTVINLPDTEGQSGRIGGGQAVIDANGQIVTQGNAAPALPPGMVKQIGTSGGKPVYLDKNGKQVIAKG